MKLSEMQRKELVDIRTGKRIGRIVDVNVDINNGLLISFVIEKPQAFKNIFFNSEELIIKFTQIKKMGEDVILIDIS